jgi:hypothetical protein
MGSADEAKVMRLVTEVFAAAFLNRADDTADDAGDVRLLDTLA